MATIDATRQTFLSRTLLQVRQVICGLHGHDSLLHFDNGRLSLLCSSCGHESPGWDVRADARRTKSTPASPRIVMPLVGERHAA